MTPENFVFWLQGFIEMGGREPNEIQWKIIQDHLKLVLTKETPNRTPLTLNDLPLKDWKPGLLKRDCELPTITC